MKNLKDLVNGVKGITFHGFIENDIDISELYIDSRSVTPNSLFCALSGSQQDGLDYVPQAIAKGASCILCEKLPEHLEPDVSYIQATDARIALGIIASRFFNNPSENLKVIAITGTNGKTSIATWLYELAKHLGYPSGLLSTIKIIVNGKEYPSTHTTPDVISINRYLSYMADAGCEYVFMEASSHALDQKRTSGILFRGAVFTNITRDHLDYHIDFQSYIKAKKILFDELPIHAFALINEDDKNGRVMLQNCRARQYGYSLERPATYQLKILEKHADGMAFMLNQHEIWVKIIGTYNAQNLAAVYGTAILLGFNEEEILREMSALKPVEGRMEIVSLGNGINGIVDYAHTPDALINVLKSLNEVKKAKARIITVVGAGGDRDSGKRSTMTRAALEGSDQVILTSDNPRSENPEKILDDMEAGVDSQDQIRLLRITDRRAAIKTAYTLATTDDIILVAGKGHETYQEVNGVKHPFDDREELKKMINKN